MDDFYAFNRLVNRTFYIQMAFCFQNFRHLGLGVRVLGVNTVQQSS